MAKVTITIEDSNEGEPVLHVTSHTDWREEDPESRAVMMAVLLLDMINQVAGNDPGEKVGGTD
jgi:hypothetical protein